MRFEARELTTFAKPIDPATLTQGEIYLSVQYADPDLLIPTLETIVFVGRNLRPNDADALYFQDVESYRRGVRVDSGPLAETGHRICREAGIKHLFDYESALEELMKCSLRRRAARNSREGPLPQS